MQRYVIDTNVWVISLTSRSEYHPIYLALVSGKYELFVSHDILLEYEEVLTEKYGLRTVINFMELLNALPNVHFVQSYFHWNMIPNDEDDNKYVDTAIASGADNLVSEDGHFNILAQITFPKVTRIRIDEFLSVIQAL